LFGKVWNQLYCCHAITTLPFVQTNLFSIVAENNLSLKPGVGKQQNPVTVVARSWRIIAHLSRRVRSVRLMTDLFVGSVRFTRLQLFALLQVRLIAELLTAVFLLKSAASDPGRTAALCGGVVVLLIALGVFDLNVGDYCQDVDSFFNLRIRNEYRACVSFRSTQRFVQGTQSASALMPCSSLAGTAALPDLETSYFSCSASYAWSGSDCR
jgi:hypothetical protein